MKITPLVAEWAEPLLSPCRYKGAKGGRSGGKSHQFCEIAATHMAANPSFKVAGIREIQKSIKYSLKSLLEKKLHDHGASYLFDFQAQEIKRYGGEGVAIFLGMQDHTADSVKGLEDFDLGLVDEANALSAASFKKLTPTFRKQGSEIMFAWNPDDEEAPVDQFFLQNEGHADFKLIHVNIMDNPWASDTAWAEYVREKKKALASRAAGDLNAWDQFKHVWLGDYDTRSDKFVFHNWEIGERDVPENVVWFYGADWGFSQDPNAGVKFCVIGGNTLYIRNEVYEVGTPTEALPVLFSGLPDAPAWPMRADSARPETIDYMRRHGYPRIRGAKKGKGSVEHGVNFLKGMQVVIHPDCVHTAREFKRYSYKVEKHTGEILPVIEDANNHIIDAIRYGAEGLHRKGKLVTPAETDRRAPQGYDYGVDDDEEDDTAWKVA
jgi:phage terminase large subunit